ncbi:MAG TPA: DegT/DnrJ/EryC1/StrS family aminotransferase [Candidatus Nanoarchaeia archaeon]|nr:DegT/DnrJ/EryC1/StrS family aminotransferase [Candidatus Nanoarchaeia archaeon]
MIPFADLQAQYRAIKLDIDQALTAVMGGSQFILGEHVSRFEQAFAAYCGRKHGIGVASGTDAIHLALLAAGITQGDEVITVANTAVATAAAVTMARATPVFVDVDEHYTMDPALLKSKITARTKAIVPVHLFGQPCDMQPIQEIAENHHLRIIEDCCQAHGAAYRGKRVPVSGTGCFSFYPTKNLGAYGDGGMVITDDGDIAERIRMLREYGQRSRHHAEFHGINSRLDELHAAVLLAKLKHLDAWNMQRSIHARRYHALLKGVVIPPEREQAQHAYHLYVIRSAQRDQLQQHLEQQGVSALVHYPTPIHRQRAFSSSYPLPRTEQYAKEILSLPLYPELTEGQIQAIAAAVNSFGK